jgi:hypothetical protein
MASRRGRLSTANAQGFDEMEHVELYYLDAYSHADSTCFPTWNRNCGQSGFFPAKYDRCAHTFFSANPHIAEIG